MPKQKTSKTMSKRVKVTASGKLLHRRATRAHKLSIKSASRKRGFTLEHENAKADSKNIKKLLGI